MPNNRSSQAPEPHPMRVQALIDNVNDGRIKVPTFQRREIWNAGQVMELLDSVRNGYPIGSLLLWRTDHEMKSERNIGGFDLPDTPARIPRDYVLDGQQRLTGIYAILTHDPANLHDRYQVLYDLRDHEFVNYSEPVEPHQVKLNVLYDMPAMISKHKELLASHDGAELSSELEELYKVFHEYEIPVIVTHDTPIEDVGVIFERINRTGTRLTLLDLMVAATWGTEGGEEFDLRERIEAVVDGLVDKDFEDLEGVTVLRSMAVVKHGSARREVIESLRREPTEDLLMLLERSREALSRAIDFLTSELSVKSLDFLPYERQLILLTYVVSKRFPLTTTTVRSLRAWFWRSSFSERYRRGGEAQFDEDLATVLAGKPNTLDRFGGPPDANFFIGAEFRKTSAAALAFAALLGKHNPINLTNGSAIDVGLALSTFNRKEFHHIFPQQFLKDRGTTARLINAMANICMLSASENKFVGSQAPSVYLSEIRKSAGDEEFNRRLQSSLIPTEAVQAALDDDYTGFLDARARHLAKVTSEMM